MPLSESECQSHLFVSLALELCAFEGVSHFGQCLFYQFGSSRRWLVSLADYIQVIHSPCECHVEQVEVIHHVLTLFEVVVVGIYRLLQILSVIHCEEWQLVIRFLLGTAPQLVASNLVGPVAEWDDDIVKFQSLALVYGYDAYSVLLAHTDGFS